MEVKETATNFKRRSFKAEVDVNRDIAWRSPQRNLLRTHQIAHQTAPDESNYKINKSILLSQKQSAINVQPECIKWKSFSCWKGTQRMRNSNNSIYRSHRRTSSWIALWRDTSVQLEFDYRSLVHVFLWCFLWGPATKAVLLRVVSFPDGPIAGAVSAHNPHRGLVDAEVAIKISMMAKLITHFWITNTGMIWYYEINDEVSPFYHVHDLKETKISVAETFGVFNGVYKWTLAYRIALWIGQFFFDVREVERNSFLWSGHRNVLVCE